MDVTLPMGVAALRVGFFGGTFDPPHLGHLAVAQAAADAFALERVLITPTGRQPLKTELPGASFADRLAMVELLCSNHPKLEACGIDVPEPDGTPNYTVDTLARLRSILPPEAQIFSIIGADAFLLLRQWREPERLLQIANWIVVSRPGFSLGDLRGLGLTSTQSERVHLLEDVQVPVSATVIRSVLRGVLNDAGSTTGLLPESVLDYIGSHHLYHH